MDEVLSIALTRDPFRWEKRKEKPRREKSARAEGSGKPKRAPRAAKGKR
jgi:hypothetical protein